MRCGDDIEQLDGMLASLAREEGALRLRLGQLLEVLGRGAVFELGFSSLGAYAVERCERSVRWAEAARCLARRLEALPELRAAMALGKMSWTMGEVLARVATPVDESRWLALAEGRTVRQVQRLVEEAASVARSVNTSVAAGQAPSLERHDVSPAGGNDGARVGAALNHLHDEPALNHPRDEPALNHPRDEPALDDVHDEPGHWGSGDGALCTLTCTVDREDAWLFEATRCLLDQLGERGVVAQSEALLAEAQTTLLALLPRGTIDVVCLQEADVARQRWQERLRLWRAEAEAACEKRFAGNRALAGAASTSGQPGSLAIAASLGLASLEHATCVMLDRQVRSLAGALARHELEVSRLALRFHRADGWRRLGYGTETQYARERLGVSRSGLAARRALALRLERLPRVASALGCAHIGVEAALQLVRIATPRTEAAWVERASRRTIKHLREEVAAALTAVRLGGESDCPPPEDSELVAFQSLEQMVVSGRFAQPRCPDGGLSTLGEATALGVAPGVKGPLGETTTPGVERPLGEATAPSVERPLGETTTPGVKRPLGEATAPSVERPLVEPTHEPRRAWCVMLGSLASWLDRGLQMSAASPQRAPRGCSSAGRVTLRLRMSRATFIWWRGLEAQARRWLPRGMSWLRFLCSCLWQASHHLRGTHVAYGHIYVRDRFVCTSPVCNRRDVTPHHIQFRSAGGTDEDHNITGICTWCHLLGIHGGRIHASGTADHIRWVLGPRSAPSLIVHGRERVAA